MIKINLILKSESLKIKLKSEIELFFRNNSKVVSFIEELGSVSITSDDLLIIFFEIENSKDIKSAKELKEEIHPNCIILLSSDEALVFESLIVQPLQFIRLNKFFNDFESMSEVLLQYINNSNTIITFKSGTATVRQNVENIIFIESYGHYLIIHSTTGDYRVRDKISSIITKINNNKLIRVHKSYIVNISFIKEILSNRLVLKNNLEVSIGRVFKDELLSYYDRVGILERESK